MIITSYPVRIKVSIFNKSKIFYSPFFCMYSWHSPPFFIQMFLVNSLPLSVYSTYKSLILDGFFKFGVSLFICKNGYKNSFSFLMVAVDFCWG